MEEKVFIGVRLRTLRDSKNISQKLLSESLGIKQPIIARYEKCAINPSYENLIKIADFFDVSTDYLLGRTDNPYGKYFGKSALSQSEQIEDFIELCFEPNTEANLKLKEALKQILSNNEM